MHCRGYNSCRLADSGLKALQQPSFPTLSMIQIIPLWTEAV